MTKIILWILFFSGIGLFFVGDKYSYSVKQCATIGMKYQAAHDLQGYDMCYSADDSGRIYYKNVPEKKQ